MAGRRADPDDLEMIEGTERRISELEAILADRLMQQREVEASKR